jgi:hypothetical protein
MTERGIIFSAESVRKAEDDLKTMTRRVVKLPPFVTRRPGPHEVLFYSTGSGQYLGGHPEYTGDQPPGIAVRCGDGTVQKVPCPYGKPGDVLYVKEVWGCPAADHPRCKDGRKPQPDSHPGPP